MNVRYGSRKAPVVDTGMSLRVAATRFNTLAWNTILIACQNYAAMDYTFRSSFLLEKSCALSNISFDSPKQPNILMKNLWSWNILFKCALRGMWTFNVYIIIIMEACNVSFPFSYICLTSFHFIQFYIYWCIDRSIFLCIYVSMYLSIYRFLLSIYYSINHSIYKISVLDAFVNFIIIKSERKTLYSNNLNILCLKK